MSRIPEMISANSFSYCPVGRLFTFCCQCKSNLTPASTMMVFLVNKLDAWPFQLIFKPLRSQISDGLMETVDRMLTLFNP